MKEKHKSAFTMFELMIVLALMGFLVIYELMIACRKMNEYNGIYYNAYNYLRTASYNIAIDSACPNADADYLNPDDSGYDPDYDCRRGPRVFPKDNLELCKRYAEYLNIPSEGNKCGNAEYINKETNNFKDTDSTKQFVTHNGMRFYIAGHEPDNEPFTYEIDGKKVKYFIMYVDLNGSKAPNRIDKQDGNKVLPDIVPFAITTRGEVIPLGFPAYSTSYMTARVRYPDTFTDGAFSKEEGDNMSESMSFDNAKITAWGDSEDMDIPFTYKLNQEFETNTDVLSEDSLAKYYIEGRQNLKPVSKSKSEKCEEKEYSCRVVIDSSTDVRM